MADDRIFSTGGAEITDQMVGAAFAVFERVGPTGAIPREDWMEQLLAAALAAQETSSRISVSREMRLAGAVRLQGMEDDVFGRRCLSSCEDSASEVYVAMESARLAETPYRRPSGKARA